MSEPDNLQLIRAFLDTQSTLALATTNPDGQPQVAPIFYVADERLNLYWLSSSNSRHSTNLVINPKVAATVYPSVWQWNDIVGLQIEGEARPIGDERIREQILTIYLRKFQLPGEFDSIISTSILYSLKPSWLRWIDNSVQFNYKVEMDL
jgi:uncharacterized protein YhbP (UPF0306 family)